MNSNTLDVNLLMLFKRSSKGILKGNHADEKKIYLYLPNTSCNGHKRKYVSAAHTFQAC